MPECARSFPPSHCVECGQLMEPGKQYWCIHGGLCSHYIPRAVRAFIDELAAQLK